MKAFRWYEQVIAHGLKSPESRSVKIAESKISKMFFEGKVVAQNDFYANYCAERADVESGNEMKLKLGDKYFHIKDYKNAAYWFTQATERDDIANAQHTIAKSMLRLESLDLPNARQGLKRKHE